MTQREQYKASLDKKPRRINMLWLGDLEQDTTAYIYGNKFLVSIEGVSLEIWKLLDGKYTVAQIAEKIASKYDSIPREQILEDTIEYIIQLEEAGLVAWRVRPLFEDIKLDD